MRIETNWQRCVFCQNLAEMAVCIGFISKEVSKLLFPAAPFLTDTMLLLAFEPKCCYFIINNISNLHQEMAGVQ